MPNAAVHALGAAVGVGLMHVVHERTEESRPSGLPMVSAGLAYCLGSIPDYLEPAIHPNHRQFFHSFAVGAMVLLATKKVYDWQPQTPEEELLRYLGLIVGGAYAVHLLLDACTKKSLPLIGRFYGDVQ